MRKIVRSLSWKEQQEKDAATKNFGVARKERLLNLRKVEEEIIDYQLEFYTNYGEAPSFTTVYDHFNALNKAEEIVYLEDVGTESFYETASFEKTFEEEVEKQAADKLLETCREAVTIATKGIQSKTGLIKGTDEAVNYLFSTVRQKPTAGDPIPAHMKKGQSKILDLYEFRKANPLRSYGILTGYGLIDSSTSGIRRKNLYLLAGFASHLKSTLMMNMMINGMEAGYNELLFTTEMPADDVKMCLAAIHSANPKFSGVGKPLSSSRLLLGALQPVEFDFFKLVLDDLVNNQSHGSIRVVDSSEFFGLGSIFQRTVREHQEEEVDELWIDYITRLPPDPIKHKGLNLTEARNEMLAESKRFGMSFDRGRGLPVCSPFQVNREGYKTAKKENGKLDKTALAQYNAAEREADVITYIWFDDEERATFEPKVGVMKSRWGDVPRDPAALFIEPESRRIFDLSAGLSAQTTAPTQAQGSDEVTL